MLEDMREAERFGRAHDDANERLNSKEIFVRNKEHLVELHQDFTV